MGMAGQATVRVVMVRKFLLLFIILLSFSRSYALDCSVFVGGCDSSATATTLSNGIQIPGDCQCDYQTILNANLTLINNNIALIGGLNTWSQLQTFSNGIKSTAYSSASTTKKLLLTPDATNPMTANGSRVQMKARSLNLLKPTINAATEMTASTATCSGGFCTNDADVACTTNPECQSLDAYAGWRDVTTFNNYDTAVPYTPLALTHTYNYKKAAQGSPVQYQYVVLDNYLATQANTCSTSADCNGSTCTSGKCEIWINPTGFIRDYQVGADGTKVLFNSLGTGLIIHALDIYTANGGSFSSASANWDILLNNQGFSVGSGGNQITWNTRHGIHYSGTVWNNCTACTLAEETAIFIDNMATGSNITVGAASGSTGGKNSIISVDSGANMRHAGKVRIGSYLNPTVALDVTGSGLVSGTLGVTGLTTLTGGASIPGGSNIALDTTTGTKIGTGTTQLLGFYNAAPVSQRSGELRQALIDLGLIANGGANALTTNNGNVNVGSGGLTSSGTINSSGSLVQSSTALFTGLTLVYKDAIGSSPHINHGVRTSAQTRNTTAAADLLSSTIGTASLPVSVNRVFRVRSFGSVQINRPSQTVDKFNYQVTMAGVVVCDTGTIDPSVTTTMAWNYEALITVQASGGANTAKVRCDAVFRVKDTPTMASGVAVLGGVIDSTVTSTMGQVTGPSAGFNLAGTTVLKTNVTFSTGDAANTITEEQAMFEVIN